MNIGSTITHWWRKTYAKITRFGRDSWARFGPRRRLRVIEGDSLPVRMPLRDLVLARDDGEDWCVGMRCPWLW
jgi:hypothetical protein